MEIDNSNRDGGGRDRYREMGIPPRFFHDFLACDKRRGLKGGKPAIYGLRQQVPIFRVSQLNHEPFFWCGFPKSSKGLIIFDFF